MIVFYARVSTTEQTTAHQRTQAEQAGFKIDKVVADEGISGVSTRLAERPEGKRLFDMLRAGDTLVVRWVDRLWAQLHRRGGHDPGVHAPRSHHQDDHQRHDVRWQHRGPDA